MHFYVGKCKIWIRRTHMNFRLEIISEKGREIKLQRASTLSIIFSFLQNKKIWSKYGKILMS